MRIFIAIVIGLIFVFGQSSFAQNNLPPKTLTLTQEEEDSKVFRGSLEKIHVGLNWFISEKELNDLFDKTYNSLTENTALEDIIWNCG